MLISIVSKDSILYKASDIKLLIPKVKEAEGIGADIKHDFSTCTGGCIGYSNNEVQKFGKLDLKLHPSGSLGAQLKTVEDVMITGNKIPFVNENLKMKQALKILTNKSLGVLIVRNQNRKTIGIITDGQIRRISQKNSNFYLLPVKKIMTKKPISVDKNELAAKALSLMNGKKITSLIVNDKKVSNKTIGIVHIHSILKSNVS